MSKEKKSEEAQFLQAMSGVRPLKKKHTSLRVLANTHSEAPKQVFSQRIQKNQGANWPQADDRLANILDKIRAAPAHDPAHMRERQLEYYRPGTPRDIIRQLARGKIPEHPVIDLHGVRFHEAIRLLDQCIEKSINQQQFWLRIIHGKGQHARQSITMKQFIDALLQADPQVQAFCSTKPRHGATGAVYVKLFKKPKRGFD